MVGVVYEICIALCVIERERVCVFSDDIFIFVFVYVYTHPPASIFVYSARRRFEFRVFSQNFP